jgi:hypothetical protein
LFGQIYPALGLNKEELVEELFRQLLGNVPLLAAGISVFVKQFVCNGGNPTLKVCN